MNLEKLARPEEAAEALRRAIERNPLYADPPKGIESLT